MADQQKNNAQNSFGGAKVLDFFTGKPLAYSEKKILRIAPELDALEMLYTNDSTADRLYSMKVALWALREDGSVVGMVPWLDDIIACTEIDDPLNGRWEGYRNPRTNEIFHSAPDHKITELHAAQDYHTLSSPPSLEEANPFAQSNVVQEIPDIIGTHAVLTQNGFRTFTLIEVLSWQLKSDGSLHGMLVDENSVASTPVLPGDPCLFPAQRHEDFRYFFQHRIANKIKEHDPEALAAISFLIEK